MNYIKFNAYKLYHKSARKSAEKSPENCPILGLPGEAPKTPDLGPPGYPYRPLFKCLTAR